MFMKLGVFLFVLTILQVSARYKQVEPDPLENEINPEAAEVSSSALRIVSGWDALPGQHPHHAALRMVNSAGSVARCGGSVIAKEWVVTSAACIATRIFIVVRAGVVSLLSPEYVFETTKRYTHPLFNDLVTTRQTNNIGLVKLERPVVYTRLLRPIRIQSSADAYRSYENEQVYTSGHGTTWTNGPLSDVLQWVYLRVISNTQCMRTYTGNIIVNTTICAQFFNVTSQSTCRNDNGGPLVHVGSNGVPTLIGVTSFVNTANCHSGLPIAFTRTGPYLAWLEEVTAIDFENLQEDIDDTTTSSSTTTELDEQSTENFTTEGSTAPSDVSTPEDFPTEDDTTPFDVSTPEDFPTEYNTTPFDVSTPEHFPTEYNTTPFDVSTPEHFPTEDNTTPFDASTPEDFPTEDNTTPDGNTTEPPEKEEDLDSSESNEDDDMVQLLKRLVVNVKVKVALNKYNVSKEVGKDISVLK
ncbi:hypothetical protein PYW07_008276 [Mythimna separata]|uniref:Peptidase S1 domain-containing protein n=1 Tax=Mythimna separata TaxID=271217 RepID=A0AAD8DNT8_MYTSE|nr:hypothetical protein PYW07_008276 [Mythimna separata]